jgi:proteasome lid subunit RPN8/RPN11
MLKIAEEILEQIRQQAENEYPRECCGLLIGRIEDGGRRRSIVETFPVANAWEETDTMHRRMLITPQDYMRAERQFLKQGLGVVGNYHSHPNHPAAPSEFDFEHLAPWPTMSYLIVSVRAGRAEELRSWELAPDGSQFIEEEISKGN